MSPDFEIQIGLNQIPVQFRKKSIEIFRDALDNLRVEVQGDISLHGMYSQPNEFSDGRFSLKATGQKGIPYYMVFNIDKDDQSLTNSDIRLNSY